MQAYAAVRCRGRELPSGIGRAEFGSRQVAGVLRGRYSLPPESSGARTGILPSGPVGGGTARCMAESGGRGEAEQLRSEVQRLTSALEDIVALALSAGSPAQRAVLMHRRAVAALSGVDPKPLPGRGA